VPADEANSVSCKKSVCDRKSALREDVGPALITRREDCVKPVLLGERPVQIWRCHVIDAAIQAVTGMIKLQGRQLIVNDEDDCTGRG
jgi:hypothetical protein